MEVQISERIGEKYRRELERLKSPHYSILNNEGILALFFDSGNSKGKTSTWIEEESFMQKYAGGEKRDTGREY